MYASFRCLVTHGCWSWLFVDGREGERHAYVVLERRRARSSARRLDGNRIDLAAGHPKPWNIMYQCLETAEIR